MPLLVLAAAFLLVLLLTWLVGKVETSMSTLPLVEGTRPVLLTVGSCACMAGAMLMVGYLFVTVPGIGDIANGTSEDQPAPISLVYVGAALATVGVIVVGAAFRSASRRPPNSQAMSSGCSSFFIAVIVVCAGDVAAAAVTLAASHSVLRWRPLLMAAIFTIVGIASGAAAAVSPARSRR